MLSLQTVNHVGLVPLDVVRAGGVALRDHVVVDGERTLLVVDAISDSTSPRSLKRRAAFAWSRAARD
jgi:hypothetical protein